MTDSQKALIQYRMERAREALDEARLLAQAQHWNACISRLYYACFYAVNALLLSRGLSSARHSGVRALFNRHFVKSGVIAHDLAACYSSLFDSRHESDYEDLFRPDPAEVEPLREQARQFVEASPCCFRPNCSNSLGMSGPRSTREEW